MATLKTVAISKKLVENLQSDLRHLSSEAKRKYPPVKEAAESGILKIRTITAKSENDIIGGLVGSSSDIIQPFVLGCDTRNPKIVLVCLTSVQRLIQHEAVSMPAANNLINMLWNLMEHGIEELKLLQTATLLITTNTIVQHESLAKAIVLCFRLHFNKDSITMNTAAATVRQLVSIVFERVITEDSIPSQEPLEQYSLDELKAGGKNPPKSLRPCAGDGFLLFQDLCQLVNADNPFWLIGMTEMTRTFGLELLESVLTTFPDLFHKHPEFSFLLKERVCPLVIKLFSPSIKYRQGLPAPPSPTPVEKPYFPIVMRLLRIVSILIKNYYTLLVTECEIFLSLLVKFLDGDKPLWERALALEVLHRLSIHRQLLRCFCQSYDMKMHSTKIFRDIVNALGTFIQTQFLSPPPAKEGPKTPDTQGSPPALVGGLPVGGGITPQPAFVYRGVWIPLIFTIPQGTIKPYFLEMLDKIEPPTVPEGYGITVAFHCLLDIVKSVESLIGELSEKGQAEKTPDTKLLSEQLIDSSWCGVLAAFSLLLDASTDETATESVLKSQQAYASLCGKLDMNTPRDAFITSLCKASLPPHYALTVLNIQGSNPAYHRTVSQGHTRQSSQDIQARANQDSLDAVERSQVVAVGTALPTAALPVGSQQGPVMLTAKNIQCMRAILSVAHCHGGILGTAWHMVVTTLQHLVWILGLKPSSGGSLKAGKQASESPNAVITTAAMADLPVLSAMLSRLFESSQYLDDVALHHLIDALCKLSAESMEIAYTNREPSLFAVAKLLETGLVNLPRVDVLWRPVTAHLLEVCHHPHQAMRSWGAEAVTALVKAAMGFRYDPPLHKNLKLQSLILAPLQEMSVISHPDIRQKQLECVLQILHNNGETLGHGWPLVLSVIGAVTKDQGENLIRIAFQSLSLVVTDFLPIMPCYCLQLCVEVAGKFGLQNQELNISLTSIGLLWNISDFFYQQREKIKTELAKEEENSPSKDPSISPFDALWMCVYLKLGDLCVDIRPAVRKSAGQTLFSTIAAHGDLLQQDTWQTVLWRVLFPLLDKVKKLSSSASDNRVENKTGGNILIHHSRDTAQKQWAETQVLTLAGVARVFNAKRHILHRLGDFPRAWALLLEFIESSSLCQNAEVALAALKSFQEILTTNRESRANSGSELQPPSNESMNRMETSAKIPPKQSLQIASKPGGDTGAEEAAIWSNAWRVWISIGTTATIPPPQKTPDVYLPTQPFLTALIQIFPVMFEHIKLCFTVSDLQKFSSVIRSCLAVPVKGDVTPFILPTTYLDQEPNLIPLQEAVLKAVDCIYMEVTKGPDSLQNMCPDLFDQLLTFVSYGVKPPSFGQIETKNIGVAKVAQMDWVTMNFVPFAEQSLDVTVNLYKTMATHTTVIKKCVLQNIIKTLASPLGLKYNHPSQSLWTLAINSLLTILELGLPIARKNESAFHGMWSELARTLEEFLFSKSCHPANYSVEDFQRDEALDCRVVELIRDDIFPYAQTLPKEFVMKIMNILNRGSIHSATSSSFFGTEPSVKLREEFAKACFETLLQFSFVSEQSTNSAESSVTKLAVSSLLQRCQEVLKKFVEDEKLSGKCPLPRTRMSEIAFVLKAISTLLVTLKRAPPANIEENIWSQVVQLYPSLVDCTTSSSPEVCRALKDALHQYKDLLAPPSVHNGV